MLGLNCLTPNKPREGVDYNLAEAVEGENFFKSKLVQRIGIPHSDTLKNLELDNELIQNIIPSFSCRADVYASEFHDVLKNSNLPTSTEKIYMTNNEQIRIFLQAENTYEGKIASASNSSIYQPLLILLQ